MGREVRIHGVAGHHCVEVRSGPVGLGTQYPPEPLRLLLPRAERPRDLDGDPGLRQVDGEVGDLAHDQHAQLTRTELVEQPLSLAHRRLAGDQRGVEVGGKVVQLVEVLADDQHLVVGVLCDQAADNVGLLRRCGRQTVPVLGFGQRVDHPVGLRQTHPDLTAVSRGDVPLRFDVTPRRIESLRADE